MREVDWFGAKEMSFQAVSLCLAERVRGKSSSCPDDGNFLSEKKAGSFIPLFTRKVTGLPLTFAMTTCFWGA